MREAYKVISNQEIIFSFLVKTRPLWNVHHAQIIIRKVAESIHSFGIVVPAKIIWMSKRNERLPLRIYVPVFGHLQLQPLYPT